MSKTIKVVAQAFRSPAQIAATPLNVSAAVQSFFERKNGASVPMPATAVKSAVVIGLPVGTPKAKVEDANKKASYAEGEGAAVSFVQLVQDQAQSLKVYLQRISETDQAWRKGFRVALDKLREDMRAYVKAASGVYKPVFEASFKSATVRISEAIGFSKAIDAGFVPNMGNTYTAIIGASVAFRNSSSSASTQGGKEGAQAVGPTKRRGRVAKPFLDKMKAAILAASPTLEQLEQLGKMVDTLIKLAKAAQDKADAGK